MQLGAGLLEFIGEIAQRLHVFFTVFSRITGLFSDHRQFEIWFLQFLNWKISAMHLNHFLKESPSIQQLCQYIATTTTK